ncbi:protein disulfide-isomerase A2 [Corythoichthys intestinalis]|uniref:protein disulfide-isomerase A2 n=1 Tax=Corythoichthys intestinalis TaxID=161448 RepID=UPI0025A689EF|nr:protein disulfide-isomerase A2 [Corythoichthys intestinalis]
MRTPTLLVAGLLLLASCCYDKAQTENATEETPKGAQEEVEEPPKKEKTNEIEEENNVMVLHVNNFAWALNQTKFLLVEFYAPWCGHCQRLEPIYAEAAGKLKEDVSSIGLAKVDAIEEKELGEEFGISSFPVLKLFVHGDRKQPVDFTGKRTVAGIIQWLKRRTGPGAQVLDTVDSAAQFVDAHNISVVGFFKSLESDVAKEFSELVMDMTDTEFGITASPEVFQKYELKSDTVVLFKKFDNGRDDFALSDGKLDKSNLTNFIQENSLELIIPFTKETGDKIFSSSIRLHCLLFINSTVEGHNALVDKVRIIAKSYKGKMLFITIDVSAELSFVLDFFGVSAAEAPTARIMNMGTGKKFKVDSSDLLSGLPSLCQEVLDGTAKPYYRSQDVPEDWNKEPVKVLVGKNFESVALDPTKNVFVEFYAPWCGHCKELAPIWDQLGEKYAKHDDIIIAKMDSTANELENISISGFPTLKYFPAGGKEVVDYTGNRDLETLSKFLDSGGVLPVENDDVDEDDNDEADAGDSSEKSDNTTSHKDEL